MKINWLTAVTLLVTKPGDFARAVRHRLSLNLARVRLRNRMRREGTSVLWVNHGWAELPFHDDGDLQELLYHICGDAWRESELALLQPHIKAGDVVLDIGANIGFITTLLSQLVGEQGIAHSFEPSPRVHEKLAAMVARNKLENVSIHRVACGAAEASLVLSSPTGSSGNATLAGQSEGTELGERVRVVRLDDYLSPLVSRVDFVKIDTEGFEDQVLAGAAQLVERFKPTFYIELSQEYRDSSLAAIEWLKSRGYYFPIDPDLGKSHNGDNFIAIHRP